jgi:hypothetical protein
VNWYEARDRCSEMGMQMASLKTDKQVVAVTRKLKNCGWRKKAKKLSVKFSTSCSMNISGWRQMTSRGKENSFGWMGHRSVETRGSMKIRSKPIIHWKDLKIASQLEVDYSP